jgi:hypothetical protein
MLIATLTIQTKKAAAIIFPVSHERPFAYSHKHSSHRHELNHHPLQTQRTISEDMALKAVGIWLNTAFEGGRHARRVEMIERPD